MKMGSLTMKKWWVLAVVVVLAMTFTSCSSRNRQLLGYQAYAYCQGDRWSFEVAIEAEGNYYNLIINPIDNVEQGDIVGLYMSDASSGADYLPLKENIPFYDGGVFKIRGLSLDEFNRYEALGLVPWDGVTSYPEHIANGSEGTFCALPYPGDGSATGLE